MVSSIAPHIRARKAGYNGVEQIRGSRCDHHDVQNPGDDSFLKVIGAPWAAGLEVLDCDGRASLQALVNIRICVVRIIAMSS